MNAMLLYAGLAATCLAASAGADGLEVDAGPAELVPVEAAPAPTHAAHEAYFEFDDHELRFRSVFELRTGGAPLTSSRFTVPEDVQIDRVEAPNLAGYRFDAEACELHVMLTARPGGLETITIVGRVPFDPGIALDAVLLPVLEPRNVECETGRLHLFAPPGLNLAVDREIATGAVPTIARPGLAAARHDTECRATLEAEPASPGLRHVVSWAYRRRPVELLVEMSRAPLRMTARVTTDAVVHPRHAVVRSRVDYQIASGRTDVFQITVPTSVAGDVRIELLGGAALAQTTRGEETADGRVPWTVITREPVTDQLSLVLTWELEPSSRQPGDRIVLVAHADADRPHADGSRDGEEPHVRMAGPERGWRVLLEPAQPFEQTTLEGQPSIRRVTGLLSVHATPDLAVALAPAAGESEPVDVSLIEQPVELPRGLVPSNSPPEPEQHCVAACRYDEQPAAWHVTWRRTRPAEPDVVISRGFVEIAAASGAAWLEYRCRYQVRASDRETLHVEIPCGRETGDLRVLGAFCDGHAVALGPTGEERRDGVRPFAIEWPRATSEEWRSLALHFQVRLAAPAFQGFGSLLELPLPRVGGHAALTSDIQALVRVPEGFALVGKPAGFERVNHFPHAAGQTGWFDEPPGAASGRTSASRSSGPAYAFRATSDQDILVVAWWNMSVATWVLSGAVFLAALVLRPTSWRNRLNMVVLAGFVVAMLAVAAPDAVRQGLVASRTGLLAGALLWACGALPGRTAPRRQDALAPVASTAGHSASPTPE